MPSRERLHSLLASAPECPPGGEAFRTAEAASKAVHRWRRSASLLRERLEELARIEWPAATVCEGFRSLPGAAPPWGGLPPSWHPADGGTLPGPVAELARTARRQAVESLVLSRALVLESDLLHGELVSDRVSDPAGGPGPREPVVWVVLGVAAAIVGGLADGLPGVLFVASLVAIGLGIRHARRRSSARREAEAIERQRALGAIAVALSGSTRDAIAGFGDGLLPREGLRQALDEASAAATLAVSAAPGGMSERVRRALDRFRERCDGFLLAILEDEVGRVRTVAAEHVASVERTIAAATDRRARGATAVAEAERAVREDAARARGALDEVADRTREIRRFLAGRRERLEAIASSTCREADRFIADLGPPLAAGFARLAAAHADTASWVDALANRARESAQASRSVPGEVADLVRGRVLEGREIAVRRDLELFNALDAIASRLCGETMARSPALLDELRRRVAEIRAPMVRALEDRRWSLAVTAPGGPAFGRIEEFFAAPSLVGRVRALRYAHRDLIRLGTSDAIVPESGLAECPLLLQLNDANPGRPPRPDIVPVRNERSIIVVGGSPATVVAADLLVRQLAVRSLGLRPPGLVQLLIIDPVHAGASLREASQLQGICFDRTNLATDPPSMEAMLRRLRSDMTETILATSATGDLSIDAALARSAAASTPFRTLCVFGFPRGFDERTIGDLEQICRSGDQAGIHVLVSMGGEELVGFLQAHPKAIGLKRFNDAAVWVQVDDPERRRARIVTGGGRAQGGQEIPFTIDPPFSPREFERIVHSVRHDHGVRDVRRLAPIEAAGALGTVPVDPAREVALMLGTWCEDPSRPATIPFGRDIAHHALLVGTTGSGKTRLLQGMVATACLRYRPEELQFWLLDFKSGTGFKPFATAAVPHCRVIGLSSDVTYGLDALDRLLAEMNRRQLAFRRNSVENLEQYAAVRARPGGPTEPFPRIVAVIDEFQTLFGRETATAARVRMAQIVQKGRSAGIHLFLSTQSLEGQAADIDSLRSQIRVNVVLQSNASTQRGVLDRDEYTDVRRIRRYEGLLDVSGSRTVFDVLDMADGPDRINPHLADALEAIRRSPVTGPAPLVYDGDGEVPIPSLEEFGRLARMIRERARIDGVPILTGLPAAVTDLPAFAELRTAMNGNVVISGVDDRQVETQLAATVLSIRGALGPDSVEVELLQPGRMGRTWESIARRFPADLIVRAIGPEDLAGRLEAIADGMPSRSPSRRRILLVREWTILRPFADFGARGAEQVEAILSRGPLAGIHVVAGTASGRRLPGDTRDYYAIRVGSAASRELERAHGFNPSATGRMFIEEPSRPDACSEFVPYTHHEDPTDG